MTRYVAAKNPLPKVYHVDRECAGLRGADVRRVEEDDERRGLHACSYCVQGSSLGMRSNGRHLEGVEEAGD